VHAPSRDERYAPSSRAPWAARRQRGSPLDGPASGHVGADVDSSYTRFAFSYASSAEAAFEKECRNYEDFGSCGTLDNAARPVASVA
jgi:hypothetical protein